MWSAFAHLRYIFLLPGWYSRQAEENTPFDTAGRKKNRNRIRLATTDRGGGHKVATTVTTVSCWLRGRFPLAQIRAVGEEDLCPIADRLVKSLLNLRCFRIAIYFP